MITSSQIRWNTGLSLSYPPIQEKFRKITCDKRNGVKVELLSIVSKFFNIFMIDFIFVQTYNSLNF